MAGDYFAKNKAAIKRGFTNLQKTEKDVIQRGIVEVAKAGLDYLIEMHNEHDQNMMHPAEDNTLAFAVGYDGKVLLSMGHNGNGGDDYDMPGAAKEKAEAIVAQTKGWVAVIYSEMEGWYRWDYELDFYIYTIDYIKEHIFDFFRPIS